MTNPARTIDGEGLANKIDHALQNLRDNFDATELSNTDKNALLEKIERAEALAQEILHKK